MITQLLLGTGNKAKVGLYREYLSELPIHILTPAEAGITDEPEETGKTLEENALLKVRYYFQRSGLPTLADDAGFEIPALGNFPGVQSRRFAGHEMDENEVIEAILLKMKDLRGRERRARMRIVCALMLGTDQIYTAAGQIEGHVPEIPYAKRRPLMPYRSLLFVDKLNKWFEDCTDEEARLLGYRQAAVEQLKKYLI